MRKIIPYTPAAKEFARKLRNNSTPGEIILWKKLRNNQVLGYDFHRQRPIGKYVVDFFCTELMLAIEIDGISHENKEALEKDIRRQKYLETYGITFLRFKESEVKKDVRSIIEKIEFWIKSTHP